MHTELKDKDDEAPDILLKVFIGQFMHMVASSNPKYGGVKRSVFIHLPGLQAMQALSVLLPKVPVFMYFPETQFAHEVAF